MPPLTTSMGRSDCKAVPADENSSMASAPTALVYQKRPFRGRNLRVLVRCPGLQAQAPHLAGPSLMSGVALGEYKAQARACCHNHVPRAVVEPLHCTGSGAVTLYCGLTRRFIAASTAIQTRRNQAGTLASYWPVCIRGACPLHRLNTAHQPRSRGPVGRRGGKDHWLLQSMHRRSVACSAGPLGLVRSSRRPSWHDCSYVSVVAQVALEYARRLIDGMDV
jgi:hypothetical protein